MSTEQTLRNLLDQALEYMYNPFEPFNQGELYKRLKREFDLLPLPPSEPSQHQLSNSEIAAVVTLLSDNGFDTSIVLRVAIALQSTSEPTPAVLNAADALLSYVAKCGAVDFTQLAELIAAYRATRASDTLSPVKAQGDRGAEKP